DAVVEEAALRGGAPYGAHPPYEREQRA
ncbi:MAG: hypothetical protein AVDCRST_MAG80-390, partial [uncultured Rubrobacteraceae bacterium]